MPRAPRSFHRFPVTDREARYLKAAGRGALSAVTEYGAVRHLADRSGTLTSYLAPPPTELFTAGWLVYAADGAHLEVTAAGREALDAYVRRAAALEALPTALTRNPMRGELHAPAEPIRILRRKSTGDEIRPGDLVTDPSGRPATYAGPSMSSTDGGRTWTPGFNARVHYAEHGGWLYTPSALGGVYDAQITRPSPTPRQKESASAV